MTPDELIDGFEAAWSGGRSAVFAELCDPAVHYEDPVTPVPLRGPTELADHAVRLWTAFPDARVERTGERLGDGRFVAAPVRVIGTHAGWLDDLPPSRRRIVVNAVLYCEVAHGRLFRVRAFFDLYDAAVQVGVLPRRGTIGDRAMWMLRGFGLKTR